MPSFAGENSRYAAWSQIGLRDDGKKTRYTKGSSSRDAVRILINSYDLLREERLEEGIRLSSSQRARRSQCNIIRYVSFFLSFVCKMHYYSGLHVCSLNGAIDSTFVSDSYGSVMDSYDMKLSIKELVRSRQKVTSEEEYERTPLSR